MGNDSAAAPDARGLVDLKTPSSRQRADKVVADQASGELVFAVVGHVGSGTSEIARELAKALENPSLSGGKFEVELLKASREIEEWAKTNSFAISPDRTDLQHATDLQNAGDAMRRSDEAAVATNLVARIREIRASRIGQALTAEPVVPDGKRRAYIMDSLRHPAEVLLLRALYGNAFTLIGIVCDDEERLSRLNNKFSNAGNSRAKSFMERDAKAEISYGQRVSDAFHLSDFFVDNTANRLHKDKTPNVNWDIPDHMGRLVDLLAHVKVVRPTSAEMAMYAAYGAQKQSACLSRQVGAALMDRSGNVVATGTNEVPRAGGGVYGEGFEDIGAMESIPDERCAYRDTAFCSNTKEQNEIITELLGTLTGVVDPDNMQSVELLLRKSRIGGLLEFSRAVHAEMDALMSAARKAVSPVGTRLFVTTFPCHYCARHIVAAGVDEVQFIEPYPKSRALKLHSDAVELTASDWKPPSAGGKKVLFRPFTGVAPQLYARLFTKDRELKNARTGMMEFGNATWGSNWDVRKVSYAQLEAKLISEKGGKE